MVKCAVPFCESSSKKLTKANDSISFHRFPKDKVMLEKWMKAVNPTSGPNIWSKVCSKHFNASSMYETKSGLRRLTENAVPELSIDQPNTNTEQMEVNVSRPSTSNVSHETLSVDDTPRRRSLKWRIMQLSELSRRRRNRCNALYAAKSRMKRKITTMSALLLDIKKKQLINQEQCNILEACSAPVADIFKRLNKKSKQYSPHLRQFALTLNFYSHRAYEYVRSTFQTCLPSQSTISNWYKSIDASPGFTKQSFQVLSEKAKLTKSKIMCNLVFDEMSIRQMTDVNGQGFVDFGQGPADDDFAEIATQALVFLLVAINESWKLPVGYFLVNGVSAEQKANLLNSCLMNCHEAGIEVVSVTFDGCPTNIAMAKLLGCMFDDKCNFKTFFKHPITAENVFVFLDACHMVKLVRNTLEKKKCFKDANGDLIKWNFFEKLISFQEGENFHFANNLTARHVFFSDQKMKVKYAVQLLSLKVCRAIEFLDKDMHIQTFSNSSATCNFIELMNYLFDILNSRKFPGYDYKTPINRNNKKKYFDFLNKAFNYVQDLRFFDNSLIIKSKNKVGFLGLCVCIESMKGLYEKLVEVEEKINFIPMYKLSQDHIELLFSVVRSHGGFNNNPSAAQFKTIYKRILSHLELKENFRGNCLPLDKITLLHCSSSIDQINVTTAGYRSKTDDHILDDEDLLSNFEDSCILPDVMLSEPTKQVISYISGYVVRFLLKKIKCTECHPALISKNKENIHKFIIFKDRGGLVYPSTDVINICFQAEGVLKTKVQSKENSNNHQKFNRDQIVISILKLFIGKDIFQSLHAHIFEQPPNSNHLLHLLRAVVQKYVDIRLTYFAKRTNLKETKRHLYNKLVLFKGQ